jgi:hypothetical protein
MQMKSVRLYLVSLCAAGFNSIEGFFQKVDCHSEPIPGCSNNLSSKESITLTVENEAGQIDLTEVNGSESDSENCDPSASVELSQLDQSSPLQPTLFTKLQDQFPVLEVCGAEQEDRVVESCQVPNWLVNCKSCSINCAS